LKHHEDCHLQPCLDRQVGTREPGRAAARVRQAVIVDHHPQLHRRGVGVEKRTRAPAVQEADGGGGQGASSTSCCSGRWIVSPARGLCRLCFTYNAWIPTAWRGSPTLSNTLIRRESSRTPVISIMATIREAGEHPQVGAHHRGITECAAQRFTVGATARQRCEGFTHNPLAAQQARESSYWRPRRMTELLNPYQDENGSPRIRRSLIACLDQDSRRP